jgi:hypothetical protein
VYTANGTTPERTKKIILGVVVTMMLGLLSGFLVRAFSKGGVFTLSDVGNLAELKPMQASLAPLDLCSVEYGRRDKRGRRQHADSLFLESCSPGRHGRDTVVVPVPAEWTRRGLGFSMARDRVGEPFSVLVEKDEVPFPDLVALLGGVTPLIEQQFPVKLASQRASDAAADSSGQARERAEEARKARAKESWPTP